MDPFTNYTFLYIELQSSIVFKLDILQFDNSNVKKGNIILTIS